MSAKQTKAARESMAFACRFAINHYETATPFAAWPVTGS